MKKRSQVFILISLAGLFSCNNVKNEAIKEETKSDSLVVHPTISSVKEKLNIDSSIEKKYEDASSGVNYSFSNDTLCQSLSIKEVKKNQKLKIPENVRFILMLHDKQHKYDNKTFEGVAHLLSSEESFLDPSEKDGGAYDAADYVYKAENYKIKIRLDIQSYEACVVTITTSQPDIVLGGYNFYLRKDPIDRVMKKGECK